MKVQLGDGEVRLRVDEDEFARLLDGESIVCRTPLPAGAWEVRARAVEDEGASIAGSALAPEMRLPRALLLDYRMRLPCREGVVASIASGVGPTLTVRFEVDMRDSIRVRGAVARRRDG